MRFSKMCAWTNTRFTTLMFLLLQVVMTTTNPASRSSVAFFKKCDLRVDAFFLNVSHNNIYICSYSCCYCLEPLIFLVLLLKMYHMLMNSWFLLPNAHKGLGLCPIVQDHSFLFMTEMTNNDLQSCMMTLYSWIQWPRSSAVSNQTNSEVFWVTFIQTYKMDCWGARELSRERWSRSHESQWTQWESAMTQWRFLGHIYSNVQNGLSRDQ